MKLNEIKQLESGEVDLKEGVIPVHITMTLEQVIREGKITNNVQTFIMAGLVDMFKGGGPYRWPRDFNLYGASTWGTSSDMIEAVRALQPSEQSQIAQWLLERIVNIAGYESDPFCHNPQMDVASWMKMVLVKNDE